MKKQSTKKQSAEGQQPVEHPFRRGVRMEDLWRHARIPPLYWSAELSPGGVLSAYVNNLPANLQSGAGLLLSGPHGTGKTYQSIAVAKACLKLTARVLFTAVPDMVSAYINNEMFDDDLTMVQAFRSRTLLIVDDLGNEYRGSGSGWSEQNIVNLLRYRIQHQRSTIVTTNMNIDQLGKVYGQGFVSLLQEALVTVTMTGADRRKNPETRDSFLRKAGIRK